MDTFDKLTLVCTLMIDSAYDDSCNETQTNWNEPIIDELLKISVID